jgi:hypothetical protein
VLDRASTFADPEIVQLLKTRFVPVAIDQAYQRRQQDAEGEFYRKIAGQGPRNNFQGTTQGLYIAGPDGQLLGYTNHRSPDRIRQFIHQARKDYRPGPTAALQQGASDARYNPRPPAGGLIVRVRAKVLGGYEPTDDAWRQIFQSAVSRDNLWMSADENRALVQGKVAGSLAQRIARFHLVDNTRGEPPMWKENELRHVQISLDKQGRLSGTVHLQTERGDRGYEAQLLGVVETSGEQVTRFDVVASGQFWGEGQFTRGAPPGKFPLAVTFSLADGSDTADAVPPQASRGWLPGYLDLGAK